MEYFKPLTPSFRQEINIGFDGAIEELKTCEPNGLVVAQIDALKMCKTMINGLPDGFPMPVKK